MSSFLPSFLLLCLSFAVSTCNGAAYSKAITATDMFRTDFSRPTLSAAFGGANIKYGGHNAILWASGGGIDVVYPAGSYSPEGPIIGGFGVWTAHKIPNTAILQFGVFFPADFNFVHGGKLAGLYGGKQSCAGGDPAVDCWSVRVMWRENGDGELYLYANRPAQDPAICQMPGNYCSPDFGWSLSTGAFRFRRGEWSNVEVRVTMNSIGQRNGVCSIRINGAEVIRYNNFVYRIPQYPNLAVDGIAMDTFFGGGSDYWATPNRQVTKFRDFVLSYE